MLGVHNYNRVVSWQGAAAGAARGKLLASNVGRVCQLASQQRRGGAVHMRVLRTGARRDDRNPTIVNQVKVDDFAALPPVCA